MPSFSPGRLGRVVTEMDMARPENSDKSRRDNVVFPAPDGEDSTSIRPRRATAPSRFTVTGFCSLNILCLFTELVDHCFQFNADLCQRCIVGFRTKGIGFSVEFLGQEIQTPANDTIIS